MLLSWDLPDTGAWVPLAKLLAMLLLAALFYAVLRQLAIRLMPVLASRTPIQWDNMMVRQGVFTRLAALAPGVIVHVLAGLWFGPQASWPWLGDLLRLLAHFWMLLFGLLCLHAFLEALVDIYNTFPFSRQLPVRGFVQVIKLIAVLVFLVLAVSLLLGKSPALLISGMGAMTAVLMLVFKDPILGFVAGIQLSANRMLSVGDWLEMPKYNADGDVIDVTLTTVKVRNWDQTITTIPTYALISDSFKNWRGMSESGGRRIMRNLLVDMASIRFLAEDDIKRLCKAQLLSDYIRTKLADIERDNRDRKVDPASPVNGRKLTNIGTFRAYLLAYLQAHPGIHQDKIIMVRQLQPTPEGLPLQIYAFTRDTAWVAHENVQSDIFDHLLAVVPEFGLRLFQSPSGADLQALRACRPASADTSLTA